MALPERSARLEFFPVSEITPLLAGSALRPAIRWPSRCASLAFLDSGDRYLELTRVTRWRGLLRLDKAANPARDAETCDDYYCAAVRLHLRRKRHADGSRKHGTRRWLQGCGYIAPGIPEHILALPFLRNGVCVATEIQRILPLCPVLIARCWEPWRECTSRSKRMKAHPG